MPVAAPASHGSAQIVLRAFNGRLFQFRASRRGDFPCLLRSNCWTQMQFRGNRRALPRHKFPIGHLDEPEKKVILALASRIGPSTKSRRLAHFAIGYAPATSGVEGSRAYRPLDEYLMPTGTFTEKEGHRSLEPAGVPGDAPAWLDPPMRRTLDFQLKQFVAIALAPESLRACGSWAAHWSYRRWKARFPTLPRRLNGSLNGFFAPTSTLRICLAEVDGWTGFADKFTHLAHGRHGAQSLRHSGRHRAGRRHQSGGPKRMAEASSNVSETDRLVGRGCFRRPARDLQGGASSVSSTRIQPIRTPLFG